MISFWFKFYMSHITWDIFLRSLTTTRVEGEVMQGAHRVCHMVTRCTRHQLIMDSNGKHLFTPIPWVWCILNMLFMCFTIFIYMYFTILFCIFIFLWNSCFFYFILCDPKRTSIYTVHVIIYIISFHYATWCHQARNDIRLNHDSATM
jgi:hypothetical protein